MSTIKVDTIQTRNGTGNITLSNPVSATTTDTTVATLLNSGSHNTTNGVLHVKQSTATNNPTMVIEQTGEGGNPSDTQGLHIKTAGQNQGTGKAIRVTTTNSNLNSGTAFDAFTVYNGGNVDVFGNLAFVTADKGIDFSSAAATTSGNTGNADPAETSTGTLLDDYEEGYFTPVSNSVGLGQGSITAVGMYVKVGNLVNITVRFNPSSAGTNGHQFDIYLPFKAASTQSSGSYNTWTGTTRFPSSPSFAPNAVFVEVAGNNNIAGIRQQQTAGIQQITGSTMGGSFNMDFTVTYRTV